MQQEESSTSSSVDWRYHMYGNGTNDNINGSGGGPLPMPSRQEMHDRWAFRQTIREETLQHRRIHKHDGVGRTGRNILYILRDREVRGASSVTLSRSRQYNQQHKNSSGQQQQQQQYNHQRRRKQQQSVFDTSSIEGNIDINNDINTISNDTKNADDNNDNTKKTDNGLTFHENNTISSNENDDKNPSSLYKSRECYPTTIFHEIRIFAEYCSVIRYHSAFFRHLGGDDERSETGERPSSSRAVSTISVAFSPDSQTMASTHGDHTVKITCCSTGRLLQTLEGHPRTPWTVKYHPIDSDILASGCLGHQVRLWNWPDKTCVQMIRLEFAIISLSFHPSGSLIAVANGTRLHFWGYDYRSSYSTSTTTSSTRTEQQQHSQQHHHHQQQQQLLIQQQQHQQHSQQQNPQPQNQRTNNNFGNRNSSNSRRGVLTEVDQRHMLRCVHFPPNGNTIIIGGVNPNPDDARRRGSRGGAGGGGISFYLRLWDFDIDAALRPCDETTHPGMARRAISNPRTFVPRALLYNDGGFDVSPDGKVLCACAEYWLPEGVDNAMELLQYDEEEEDEEEEEGENNDNHPSDNNANATMPIDGAGGPIPTAGGGSSAASTTSASNERQDSKDNNSEDQQHTLSPAARQPPSSDGGETYPRTPTEPHPPHTATDDFVPRTPPRSHRPRCRLSPPSPPGRRFSGPPDRNTGAGGGATIVGVNANAGVSGSGVVAGAGGRGGPGGRHGGGRGQGGVPVGRGAGGGGGRMQPLLAPIATRPPHPLSIISGTRVYEDVIAQKGRYVPHVVTVSLDTSQVAEFDGIRREKLTPVARGYRPRLGQLLEASPLDGAKASAVTCVKFSPSTDFCLIGFGVREPIVNTANGNGEDGNAAGPFHPVTALYRIRGGMTHVSTMLSSDDDVNIARFHPDSGYGFVYGTKQGRVRVLSPRPWNFYNC